MTKHQCVLYRLNILSQNLIFKSNLISYKLLILSYPFLHSFPIHPFSNAPIHLYLRLQISLIVAALAICNSTDISLSFISWSSLRIAFWRWGNTLFCWYQSFSNNLKVIDLNEGERERLCIVFKTGPTAVYKTERMLLNFKRFHLFSCWKQAL